MSDQLDATQKRFFNDDLETTDSEVFDAIRGELSRQRN